MKIRMIAASRGRDPENPCRRTKGGIFEQTLEIKPNGVCGTLSSVAKDNLVLEITVNDDKRSMEED